MPDGDVCILLIAMYKHWVNDGQIFIQNKQYNEAESILQKLVTALEEKEINVEKALLLAEAYNNLGFICYKKVEFCKAVEHYNKAIKFNPEYGVAYYNRGTIHYRLGFYDTAIKDMENAVLFDPDNVEFKTGLENCKHALKLLSV